MANKKIYFASDFHLGFDGRLTSTEREKMIVSWLDKIQDEAEHIYLVGDLFDFWYEYAEVITKGHFRLFAKLSEILRKGIPITILTGNHDVWMGKYITDEIGAELSYDPILRKHYGKTLFIAHGDGLGPGDYGYKFIKKVFRNPFCQFLFSRLHPNLAIRLMKFFSDTSRDEAELDIDVEKERQIIFSEEHSQKHEIDFYVMGHRHVPMDHGLKNGHSRYVNLGDWVRNFTFGVLDEDGMRVERFEG